MIARRSLLGELVTLCAVVGGLLFVWCAPALGQRLHEFSQSFGSEGSGDGQLMRPGAMAVNEETGDVYVVDVGNGRVEIFSSTGAYIGQFNGSASPTGALSWPQPAGGAIAVDNSINPLDPSKGDVYVVDGGHGTIDKFNAAGAYIGQVTRSAGAPVGGLGIAVDANGSLWVQHDSLVEEFNDAVENEFVSELALRERVGGAHVLGGIGFAFDSEGDFYIGRITSSSGSGSFSPEKFNGLGTVLGEELGGENATGFAVDESSDDLYIDNGTSVAALSPSGLPIERFGSEQMSASAGVAVNSSSGMVYASDATNQDIDIFTALIVPDVTSDAASNLGETSATVNGVVDPDGLPVSSCVFEYGTTNAYGQTAECSPSSPSGNGPVAVSANLSGLEPLTSYHYRLKVSNANGSNEGQDRTFLTPVPVALSEEGVSDVSATGAQFGALVNPGGSDTTFHFEYGTSASYGGSVPVPGGDAGAQTSVEPVSVTVQNLVPETLYHVRIVASNGLGTVYGPDQTFTTQAGGGGFTLPDGREWELVTPPNKYGTGLLPFQEGIVEAAENGSAITYYTNGPLEENPAGNPSPFQPAQAISRRGAEGGWSTEEIVAPRHDGATETARQEYRVFSPDLSRALVEPGSTPLAPGVTERTLYIRNNATGEYLPLVTPENVPAGTKYGAEDALEAIDGTPDLSHVMIHSTAALTSNARELGSQIRNLYEWSGGRLVLVNVLPNGTEDPQGGNLGDRNKNFRNAVSSDGSRVFWTDASPGGRKLYMRDTVTEQTTQVDAPAPGVPQPPEPDATFEIASATGSKVFFVDEQPLTADSKLPPVERSDSSKIYDLYVYDTEAKTLTDLTGSEYLGGGELAGVRKSVMGASEDGSIVYFVATGRLAPGAQAGQDNLYVESETGSIWSAPRLVAVLSQEDKGTWGGEVEEGSAVVDSPMQLASKVSPNGRFLTFMSDRSLTGYDNRDASSGKPDEEVYLYDEATGHLTCVSCNPTGARPTGVFDERNRQLLSDYETEELWVRHWLAADVAPWEDTANQKAVTFATYQSRYLTDEGRLFFTSFDSLVARDTNGKADVYEYEPQGIGSCTKPDGCVSLISSGTSSDESAFLDASGTGPGGAEAEDVFFLTTSRLTSRDYDTSYDVYDAHVCSQAVPCVSAPATPPECSSGDACKAAPSLQPAIFGAPASATFSGSGDVQSSPVAVATPKQASEKHAKHKKKQKRPHKKLDARRSGARKSSPGVAGDMKGKRR